ncbi:hypothetical protein [Williamsia sp.]|uniref:hypothetical protein n=1 Tax=Williamsia sp. TaxID=1872085 RepID=UPI002F922FF7
MYQAVAKLVLAADQSGKTQYFYEGSVVPWLSDTDRDRFLAEGLVVELDSIPSTEDDAGEPSGDGQPAGAPRAPERPAKAASKALWVEFAVASGAFTQEDAEKAEKADLVAALS